MARRRHNRSGRPYARTDRVNELVREIVADELQRIGDERLEWVTVTSVTVDNELSTARVYVDALDQGPSGGEDGADVVGAAILAALGQHRVRLQAAIGRQARMRRTPELSFRFDPAVVAGARVEEILRDLVPAAGDSITAEADVSADPDVGEDSEPGLEADVVRTDDPVVDGR